jgi:hypothetical protein
MSSTLASRIAMLEAKNPKPARRVVRVVTGEGQEAEARRLLQSEGLDPDADDLFIIYNCIVAPDGEEPYSEPPSILSVSDGSHIAGGGPPSRPPRR